MTWRLLLALWAGVAGTGCVPAGAVEPEALRVEVAGRYPHDRQAWTQGLVWNGATLYESTGLTGQSTLREVLLETGAVVRSRAVEAPLFAEGLALVDGRLIQLTWLNRVAIVYDEATFDPVDAWSYAGEGWGLTNDGSRLIMSNGTETLQFRDPGTFALISTVDVTVAGAARGRLNELEWVDGFVYANVWMTDEILKIDPATGAAVAVIDASGLLTPAEAAEADVLNGIAFRPETGHFLVTGKWWPWVFEVDFVPVREAQGLVLGGEASGEEPEAAARPAR